MAKRKNHNPSMLYSGELEGKSLDELNTMANNLGLDLDKVRDRIDSFESLEKLPILKKKYEGKYFIYENSDSLEMGYLYIHVHRVKVYSDLDSSIILISDVFENVGGDMVSIRINGDLNWIKCNSGLTPSTKSIFEKQFKKLTGYTYNGGKSN